MNLSMVFTASLGYPRALQVSSAGLSRLFLTNYPAMRSDANLVFDSGRNRFVLHGGSGFADTWELELGPSASYSTFGQGCIGSRGIPTLVPQGSPTPRVGGAFTLQVNNLPWTGPAFLFFGFSDTSYGGTPLPFNLGVLGAPLCSLLVSGDILYPVPNVLGVGTWSFPVPNYPGYAFFNQAFAFDPVANALGLTVSNAGRGVIGS
ncbi:MAG: hypothetical protein HZB39_10420 [Planctomycetes bacterium]|nr:hypothetical protein [Planctomycetota bacterium]